MKTQTSNNNECSDMNVHKDKMFLLRYVAKCNDHNINIFTLNSKLIAS